MDALNAMVETIRRTLYHDDTYAGSACAVASARRSGANKDAVQHLNLIEKWSHPSVAHDQEHTAMALLDDVTKSMTSPTGLAVGIHTDPRTWPLVPAVTALARPLAKAGPPTAPGSAFIGRPWSHSAER